MKLLKNNVYEINRRKCIMLSNANGFSGIHTPLYQELKKAFDVLSVIDPFTVPASKKINTLLKTFSLNKKKWGHNYHHALHTSKISSSAFRDRIRYCNNAVKKFHKNYDFIFQLSSMFMLTTPPNRKPYFIYIDRTQKMAEQFYPELFAHLSAEEKTNLNTLHATTFINADLIFTFNEMVKDSLIRDYAIPAQKIFSVSSGVNSTDFEGPQKPKSKLVISVCSDFRRHGGQLVIDSFRLASQRLPNVKFLFVGKNVSNTKADFDTIQYMPYTELINTYKTASVALMLSPLGGLQTITDAMAQKCICLTLKNNPYATSIIKHGVNGFMVNDTPEEISNTIVTIINNHSGLVKKIGNEASRHILRNHTWKAVVDKINHHITTFLSE